MAGQLSQEEVLDFLCQGGGKVPNASLLAHFKHFLRDPRAAAEQLLKNRERFKRYVNSVAVVKQEGDVKYVVLRSRYRDLLGEDMTPGSPGEPEIGDNRRAEETGSGVLHGAQVGGGWSAHTEGNGYHRGEPVTDRYQQQGPAITADHPAWTGRVNGTFHEKIGLGHPCIENLQTQRLQRPSSQPTLSSAYTIVPTDHSTTSLLGKNPSSVNNTSLLNANSFPQGTNEPRLSSRSFSLDPSDASLATMKNSSTLINTSIPSTKASSSPSLISIPSTNISLPSYMSVPFTRTSSSPNDTSIPFTRTSSSPNDTSIPFTRTSSSPNDTSVPFIRTSSSSNHMKVPFTNISPPNSTVVPFTKTSSSPSDTKVPVTDISPLNNTSVPFSKTSSASSNTSVPFSKTTSSPSNASTKTSGSLSNTSSPPSKDFYPAGNISAPYSKDSSFCSSYEAPSLHQSPFPDASEPLRPFPNDDHRTETNPAFVSVSCRGQKEQKLACTDIQTPSLGFNSTFPQEAHSEEEDNSKDIKEQRHGFYEDSLQLTTYPPSSRYMSSTHPSSSLLLPHESSITPVNIQLEDYQPASPCTSPPPLPLNDMHDMWMFQMPVFKSIRCQLSLQDMEDFVDQESCGSEESDSGEGADCDTEHKDDEDFSSDSNTGKYAQYIEQKCDNTRRCPPNRKFVSIIEQYNKLQSEDLLEAKDTLAECDPESNVSIDTRESPYIAKSFLTDQAPVLFELARHPPKHRASSRFQELMSSSDDELIDRDYKRRRRPSRTKRPPNVAMVPPQPDVDLLLTIKPVNTNKFNVNLADQKDYQAQYVPKANVDFWLKKSLNDRSSTVPLDPAEHDWIVKSASGSWLQVYGLFNQDPQLALRKDFISGYTALHWFAKHGAIEMFHKFVAGAKKVGVQLDFNIKSNGGYTPLHIAAIHGHHKVAAMLVEKLKVNVKLRDNSGKRAWQYLNCNTSGEVWQLLGAPKGKTIFASRTLNTTYQLNMQNKSSQINRKTSLAAFLKPQHQKWKANNHPVLKEREIYSD